MRLRRFSGPRPCITAFRGKWLYSACSHVLSARLYVAPPHHTSRIISHLDISQPPPDLYLPLHRRRHPIPTHTSSFLRSFLLRSFTSPSFSLLILRSIPPVSTPDCPPHYPEIRSARSPLRTGTSRLTSSFLKRTFCILIRWARVLQHPKTMAERLKTTEHPDQTSRMMLQGVKAHRLKMCQETEIAS